MIDWSKSTKEDTLMAMKVVERYEKVSSQPVDRQAVLMDLEVTNICCPLDWQKLLDFRAEDFLHDIFGIFRHIDREKGVLTDCFCPRSAKGGAE